MAGESIRVETLPPGPTPINQQGATIPPMDESSVRTAVMQAESKGTEVVDVPHQAPAQTPAPQAPTQEVPAKFQKLDGTVDVQKLQDSTKQLDAGIEQKQLTIDEMLAQYKDKEKQFRSMSTNPEVVQRMVQPQAPPPQFQPQPVQPMAANPSDLQAQLNAEFQRDPVGTIVDLVRGVTQNQQKPVLDFIEQLQEQQRDNGIKNNLSSLAADDPRVLNPQLYAEITKELDSDPGYWRLKNPHKAAWNEVKGRLRLGDVQTPAQPSRTATPILGGGTPPPVPSSSSGIPTPQNVVAAIGQIKTPEERQNVEAVLRQMVVQNGGL